MSVTILVADDEVPIVELLADLLEEAGYRVIPAYNGADALRLIEREPPSLLITDNMMPRLSGLQLIERLGAGGEPPFPIILMSAVNPERLPASISFVPKPFDLDQLLNLIDRHLAADQLA
jgi:two-component system response regulator (stage 0 sporulation protein F)